MIEWIFLMKKIIKNKQKKHKQKIVWAIFLVNRDIQSHIL